MKRGNGRQELTKALAAGMRAALGLVASILLGVLAGLFLDRLAGSSPLFVILLSLAGVGLGMRLLYDIGTKGK